ncbi:MAG: hypothetical protein LBQ58_05430 [Synergistaceae bacterium]|nr:hypothetical protein [Synergistaceae bacterium]
MTGTPGNIADSLPKTVTLPVKNGAVTEETLALIDGAGLNPNNPDNVNENG